VEFLFVFFIFNGYNIYRGDWMETLIFGLLFSIAILIILNIYKNNQINKMENEIKNLKRDMIEIREIIYK